MRFLTAAFTAEAGSHEGQAQTVVPKGNSSSPQRHARWSPESSRQVKGAQRARHGGAGSAHTAEPHERESLRAF
jgi:hypothetical protein